MAVRESPSHSECLTPNWVPLGEGLVVSKPIRRSGSRSGTRGGPQREEVGHSTAAYHKVGETYTHTHTHTSIDTHT